MLRCVTFVCFGTGCICSIIFRIAFVCKYIFSVWRTWFFFLDVNDNDSWTTLKNYSAHTRLLNSIEITFLLGPGQTRNVWRPNTIKHCLVTKHANVEVSVQTVKTYLIKHSSNNLYKCSVFVRSWRNGKCLSTKHHQTLFGDQTVYRLDTLFGAVWWCLMVFGRVW